MATDGYVNRWNGVAYPAASERLLGSALLMPGPAGEPFSARSGRRVGGSGLTVTVGGSPESATVTSGAGVIYDSGFAAQGPYVFELPASKSVALPARPASGQSRIDLVIARVYDSDAGVGAAKELKIELVAGVPGASPSAPTLPALSLELARLTVPASGTVAVTGSSRRSVAAGGILPVATTAERDAIASPWRGLVVDNAQTNSLERFDGTAWKALREVRSTDLVVQCGQVRIEPVASTPTSVRVNFPTPFSTVPRVVVSPNSGVVGSTVIEAGTTATTTTGFDAVLYRTNSTPTNVDWIAVG